MKRIIAGNWKMNLGPNQARVFLSELTKQDLSKKAEWVVFPPFVSLAETQKALTGTSISWGAQNAYPAEKGAFTGEVAVPMLIDLGCRYLLIGHSERRQFFGETNDSCALKVQTAQAFGLIPMLCVGETLAQRDSNATQEVVTEQLEKGLSEAHKDKPLTIAYEPVWAIGTGKVATPEQAQSVHLAIRKVLERLLGPAKAKETAILYGGSVKADNAAELAKQADINGFLVGGASLEPKSFAQIGSVPL
ncbi:MAG: triose-phosphate isomerase [Oligoflexia bacterium]|nr:triose-phosphate isomerase [Oligoflexia bacterium]